MTLVDSNVLVDVLRGDPQWLTWSIEQINSRASLGPVYFNEIVYSELAVKSASESELDRSLTDAGLLLLPIPKSAYFLAGKIFGRYRSAGGIRTSNLPDFFIGAHAQVAGLPILTRDVGRFRTYFPKVELIAPDV
ncbi:MAG TPA: type II toxin-antitoxin system VapC family toxin [Rhizomicrobium sp.]